MRISRAGLCPPLRPHPRAWCGLATPRCWPRSNATTQYGDELTTGAGKAMRDGGGSASGTAASGALDMVIQNAVILDAELGIVKGDIGIRAGRIVGIGKAGNPDIMDGVDPDLVTGPNTTVVHGDNHFVTAGAIRHMRISCRRSGLARALAGGDDDDRHVAGAEFRRQLLGAARSAG